MKTLKNHILEMGIACWVGMTVLNAFVNTNTFLGLNYEEDSK